jgi:hypothetical protein
MKLGAMKQVAGEAQYAFDVKQTRDGLKGALAMTQQVCLAVVAVLALLLLC